MSTPPSLRTMLIKIIAENGGMARAGAAAKSFALLAAAGFASVMPLAAGYELYRVYDVSGWSLVPARIVSATLEPSAFRKGVSSWRYRIVDLRSGAEIETGDMRPGDLPFSFLYWSTADGDAARFHARAGQVTSVRRSPDGREFYPEAGNSRLMIGVLLLCGLFWGGLFWRRRHRN
jgi:hypothetical protein